MLGFKTRIEAERAAKKEGIAGLTGRGQTCGVIVLDDGSYVYMAAHSVFDEGDEGSYLTPNGLKNADEVSILDV